ncbi:MAG: hypothetical protein ACTHOU_01385 [Aureliella sp.]
MSNNTPHKEQPADKTSRLLTMAKAQLDRIASKAIGDQTYFGRPSIELIIQNGSLEAVNVNEQRSHK